MTQLVEQSMALSHESRQLLRIQAASIDGDDGAGLPAILGHLRQLRRR